MEGNLEPKDASLLKARSDRIEILPGLQALDEAEEVAEIIFSTVRKVFDEIQTANALEGNDQEDVASHYVQF